MIDRGKEKGMKEHVLITGGAGYLGSALVPRLLQKGYAVTVYDNLMYNNGNSLLGCFRYDAFNFVNGDIRDYDKVKKYLEHADVVIHLAAIVGYPACKKDPQLAKEINEDAGIALAKMVKPEQTVLAASTGSNYGKVEGICTEDSPLNPLTVYGRTKTNTEMFFHENVDKAICYRFATAFGVAQRMRMDLLINDFTYQAIVNNFLLVYEKHFRRTFIHVNDIARAFVFALENKEQMWGEVYNVGSNSMNYTKQNICEIIKEIKPEYYLHYAEVGHDADQRDYEVSYDKLHELGFDVRTSIKRGIWELKKVYEQGMVLLDNPYNNV